MDFERSIWDRGFHALVPVGAPGKRRRAHGRVRTLALAAMVLGSMGGAALLGAAVVALVTPTSGRELRRKLAHALDVDDEDEDDARADYDSGEFVVADIEANEHHLSRYPAAAQPTNEDDVFRAMVENDLPS
jgi:hypothetical protein